MKTSLRLLVIYISVILITSCGVNSSNESSSRGDPQWLETAQQIDALKTTLGSFERTGQNPISTDSHSSYTSTQDSDVTQPPTYSTEIPAIQKTKVQTPNLNIEGSDPGETIGLPISYPIPWEPTIFDHFYLLSPIMNEVVTSTIVDYAYGDIFDVGNIHTGIDIPVDRGTDVFSAGSGKVLWSGYGLLRHSYDSNDPYGLAVVVKHDFGYNNQSIYTVYAHLDKIYVKVGDLIRAGHLLGVSGNTGSSSGPHLHFEVRLGENQFVASRNPVLWISPPKGYGILVGQVKNSFGYKISNKEILIFKQDGEYVRRSESYGVRYTNSEPVYDENFVVGDLRAGKYILEANYLGVYHRIMAEIYPGRITYFQFKGTHGFELISPNIDFPTPEIVIATPP